MARVVGFVLVLVVGVGGILPRWTAWRCAMMESIEDHACCDESEAVQRTIGTACCDAVESPILSVRIAPRFSQPEIAPAPFAGLLSSPVLPVLTSFSSAFARNCGFPPHPIGNILALSSVLRI